MPTDTPTDKPDEASPPRWVPCPTCGGPGVVRGDALVATDATDALIDRIITAYLEHYSFPWQGESHMRDCLAEALAAQAQTAPAAAERERAAALCEAARPAGGRAWDESQAACYDALTHVAEAIRGRVVGQWHPAPTLSSLRGMARGATGGRTSEEVVQASREGWAADAQAVSGWHPNSPNLWRTVQPVPTVPSDADLLEAVEQQVGMGHGAWDCLDPLRIVRAFHALLARYGSQAAPNVPLSDLTDAEIADALYDRAEAAQGIGGWDRYHGLRAAAAALRGAPACRAGRGGCCPLQMGQADPDRR